MKKAICLMALTLLLAPGWAAEFEGKTVTVTGKVRAAETTSRGEPQRVYIDLEEEPILLSRQDKGKELLKLVGATVQVTGHLRKVQNNDNFTKVIFVTEYDVQEPPAQKPASARDGSSDQH